jgi:hypothetical protein
LGSSFPMKYLGFLVGAYFKVKFIWDDIIKKMECWLVGWKIMHLFKDERITLIKSTLSNVYLFHVSFSPPRGCYDSHKEVITRLLVGWYM